MDGDNTHGNTGVAVETVGSGGNIPAVRCRLCHSGRGSQITPSPPCREPQFLSSVKWGPPVRTRMASGWLASLYHKCLANCSFTSPMQPALLEKPVEKAQYEEINNESESHQMPVAADRLEPRMRTPRLGLRRGGGCRGREADDWALDESGRTGRGGLHLVGSRLPDPPLPPSSTGAWWGNRALPPTVLIVGAAAKMPTYPPKETHPRWLSTYYVSGLRWHFLLPSHSIFVTTRGNRETPISQMWKRRLREGLACSRSHNYQTRARVMRIQVRKAAKGLLFSDRLPYLTPQPEGSSVPNGFCVFTLNLAKFNHMSRSKGTPSIKCMKEAVRASTVSKRGSSLHSYIPFMSQNLPSKSQAPGTSVAMEIICVQTQLEQSVPGT